MLNITIPFTGRMKRVYRSIPWMECCSFFSQERRTMSAATTALTALSAAIDVVLAATTKDLQHRVGAMREADEAYSTAMQRSEEAAVQALLTSVVQQLQPATLSAIDFASSLSSERTFFNALIGVMARDAAEKDPPYILTLIGGCRRNKGYSSMNAFCRLLDQKLQGDKSPEAYGFRAKALYERHMAAYQQAEEAQGSGERLTLYQNSLDLAQRSATAADLAGDPCGRLFVETTKTGLLLPRLGRWAEGFRQSERVSAEAEALAVAAPDDETKKRPFRVAMNCYLHRIDMLVQNGGEKDAVKELLGKLNGNPIYQACKEHADVKAAVECAQRYISV